MTTTLSAEVLMSSNKPITGTIPNGANKPDAVPGLAFVHHE
jgi:hypothetical protein